MTWVNTAILSSALLAVVSIIDSHLLSMRMPSLRAYLIPVGVIHLLYGSVAFGVFPLPAGVGTLPVLLAVASGFLRAVAVILMLYSMQTEEVSRVIPVMHTFPVFVAILAIPLLGETIGYLQWVAIIITVAGAVLISTRRSTGGSTTSLRKSFGVLLGASLLLGIANIASKYALDYVSFWNMFSINVFCMSFSFFVLSLRPRVLRELRDLKQRGATLALLAFNETLAPVAIVLSFWAMERGPVSLVSTIMGGRPVFVFIFALILSRASPVLLEWRLSKGTVALRLISVAMIFSGVAIIHLT